MRCMLPEGSLQVWRYLQGTLVKPSLNTQMQIPWESPCRVQGTLMQPS